MNNNLIPKDLPKTNPLLFSFLMILDAMKDNILFNGKYERSLDKLTPAFEYAVNRWSLDYDQFANGSELTGAKLVRMQVVCAIWKDKPEHGDNGVCWSKFPNSDEVKERAFDVSYFYDFDEWRTDTFSQLEKIISGLVFSDLANIFGWKIENNSVSYVYARDSTSNKFYGIGAEFTLIGNYFNCCPTIDESALRLNYFKSLGFVFNE